MPELPEVETIRRTLEPHLVGRRVERLEVRNPKFVAGATPEEFARAVEGSRITGLSRKGKFLIIDTERPAAGRNDLNRTDGDRTGSTDRERRGDGLLGKELPAADGDIAVHLKMAGQLVYCPPDRDLGPTRERHTHVVFRLDDGNELRYVDTRHFGRVYYLRGDRSDPLLDRALRTLAGLGPEPREGGLEWETFRHRLGSRNARIKPLLLDQAFVAGLGNIYADECLFRAGIHPLRRASSLTEDEAGTLYRCMREVIAEAITHRGTSVRDYVDGDGREGSFAERLQAYGRTGEPCPRCGTKVSRIVIAGRGSHFCPKCQLEDEPGR
ncbi:MAG: bifunctional DNA-formamidopyrimidine glycosylase/DNA-(apurinic or apyrimidinic site) lyase [Bacillota bacterium]|nr:MAG: bifunctional DNA-formamidopyrimidine glycosylase/DNA-(apurinic or apyrimidinic site) lyase [Bacillota bacterium]